MLGLVWRDPWQVECEGGAVARFALYRYLAIQYGGDNVVADAQAKTAAALPEFGSEERVKNFQQVFCRNAVAVVTELNLNSVVVSLYCR